MPLTPQQLLEKFQMDNLPADHCVFWSHGGSIVDEDDRRSWSVNEELHGAFIQTKSYQAGIETWQPALLMRDGKTPPPPNAYVGLTDALGYTDGDARRLLSGDPHEIGFWDEKHFWRDISVRFAQKAEGIISVAVDGAAGNTNFRLFEYPAIMANDKITGIRVITGDPKAPRTVAYVDTLTKEFNQALWPEYRKMTAELGEHRLEMVITSMICKPDAPVMTKEDWGLMQKRKWFDKAIERLMNHLDDAPDAGRVNISSTRRHYDDATQCMFTAKAQFLCEVVLCLREAEAQKKRMATGDMGAQKAFRQEQMRLEECLDIMNKYPEVLYFDEPATDLEKKRTPALRLKEGRASTITQEFGQMMIRKDENLTLADKHKAWGKYDRYDDKMPFGDAALYGLPKVVEDYTRRKLSGLRSAVEQALTPATEIILTNDEDEVRRLVKEGYCPVECSINGHSIVDDLVMDHHEDRSHLEPVSIRALRDHAGARAHDPRFVVVGACDADAAFAIGALAGTIPVNAATMTLGETIGIMDTTPVGKDILKLPYGEYLAAWLDKNTYSSRKPEGAYAAVADWESLSAAIDNPDAALNERLAQSVQKESARHQTALDDLARAKISGGVCLINHSDVFGFSEWHGRNEENPANKRNGWNTPVVVIYNRKSQTMGISCPNKEVAEEVFGKGGLRNVFDKLEGKNGMSFGGRESIGGSPRGQVMSFEDAEKVQQVIASTIDALDRTRMPRKENPRPV